MNGTDEQVRLANDIKNEFETTMNDQLKEYERLLAEMPEKKHALITSVISDIRKAIAQINCQNEASFWLELGKHRVEDAPNGNITLHYY